ncbi:hypothetical protein JTB14_001801 [Gonioctena quinquepunctata]|nr:hypothetical protein JTB14_001801 [Gonioctena quinquepunctata]
MGEVVHQNNSEGVVDIYDYTTDLILETCPTMEASSIVSTAESLIRRATEIERRETTSLQNGRNLIENEVVANMKMEGKLLLGNNDASNSYVPRKNVPHENYSDTLDASLYGKKKDRRNCLETIVEEDPVSSNRKIVFKPWKNINSKRRLQKSLRQYHEM